MWFYIYSGVMSLFLASYTNKLDKKGRISVPAPFRNAIGNGNFNGVVLFRSYASDTIEGCSMDYMEKLSNKIEGNDQLKNNKDELSTAIFADAQPILFDQDGRITLPEEFLCHGKIENHATFVGCGSIFQVWNPEKFKKHQIMTRQLAQDKKLSLRNSNF